MTNKLSEWSILTKALQQKEVTFKSSILTEELKKWWIVISQQEYYHSKEELWDQFNWSIFSKDQSTRITNSRNQLFQYIHHQKPDKRYHQGPIFLITMLRILVINNLHQSLKLLRLGSYNSNCHTNRCPIFSHNHQWCLCSQCNILIYLTIMSTKTCSNLTLRPTKYFFSKCWINNNRTNNDFI